MAKVGVAYAAASQPNRVQGVVAFAGGDKIPKGRITLLLPDHGFPEVSGKDVAQISLYSDGNAEQIDFSYLPKQRFNDTQTQQIVARLERADGWLIARGSAKLQEGSSVHITLGTVMY
ncbi:hypothetical protein [Phaeobacter sp. C3_T13_0]|uniref:hypothetical protein n=1 Tax=Phaeobacter cretensis TaxID=3342641 RepID=UPI0039BCF192